MCQRGASRRFGKLALAAGGGWAGKAGWGRDTREERGQVDQLYEKAEWGREDPQLCPQPVQEAGV